MTQNATAPLPEEFLSLSELARWSHLPTERLRRELKKGVIVADAKSGKEILFRKANAAGIIKTLHKL